VQIKLNDVDTRLARIERVMANQSLLQLANEVETLRADVRTMHNDVDHVNHDNEASRKQQRDLYADLDQRLKVIELRGGQGAARESGGSGGGAGSGGTAGGMSAGGAGAGPGGAAVGQSSADGPDHSAYQTAFSLLKDSQYDKAIESFRKFLITYPQSSLADNALYWLGEAYYVNKQFSEAQASFQSVPERYPQSRKLPDALLKIGYCHYELKEFAAAKSVLSKVTANFADTPAGRLAQQRLEKMAADNN
jgi:tol-pal system protein YbgF